MTSRAPQLPHSRDLGIQVGRPQIQVHAVLPPLPISHLLQQHLDANPVSRHETQVHIRLTDPHIPKHPTPELRRPLQIPHINHHNQLAPTYR